MIKKINNIIENSANNLQSISLLFARVLVAYGFYEPAINKWKDIEGIASWFASIGIPFSIFNAYASATVEALGVLLLTFGLFTRYISIGLIFVMIVAIFTVHLQNGYSVGDNGFEIPLYYISFLLIFTSFGAGKISLDKLYKRD